MDNLFDVTLPIVELINAKFGEDKDYLSLVCMGAIADRLVGFRFNIDKHLKPFLAFKDNENELKETGEGKFEDGGAFFSSIGEPTFYFASLLAHVTKEINDDHPLEEAREFVASSSLLLFGDLKDIHNIQLKDELKLENIPKVTFSNAASLTPGGKDQLVLKVITYDQENFNNSAEIIVQIDLKNKLFHFIEKDPADRLNLLKAFMPIKLQS